MSESTDSALTLTAQWILPVDGPPLPNGHLTIQSGRIVALEPDHRRPATFDFGQAAILPGLVNAHTHLDLSGLGGQVPPGPDFTGWLSRVIQHRREQTPAQMESSIARGLAEAIRFGTTLIGDIAGLGQSWATLSSAPIRAVVFHELLGLSRPRAAQAWAQACAWIGSHRATATCRPGLSPHAPYSVRASLFHAAARLATAQQVPLAIHLAESRAELELLEHHSGPFRPFLERLGVWDPTGLVRDPKEMVTLPEAGARVIFAHGNYLDVPAPRSGATLVYCPRTHAAFDHEPYPLERLQARGWQIALGTDSLASNPDLDVLAEARHVRHAFPHLQGAAILQMATLAGAQALGWATETGSLTPGKSADLVVVPLPSGEGDPYERLLRTTLPVTHVACQGVWLGRPPGTGLVA